jgi:putative ABC transport system permease protein
LGLRFVLAVFALLLLVFALTRALLLLLKRASLPTPALRQAVRGLFRPRNSTALIVITLAASLSVILTLTTVERNLDAAFVRSYPEDAPNLFFVDIQPSQLEEFKKTLGAPAEYFPVVRARISLINGKPVDPSAERRRRGDNLAREFNLTYRDHLLGDENIVRGAGLFSGEGGEAPVSVLDSFADGNGVKPGDTLVFNIQGVPVSARVSSIRRLTKRSLQPFFYFVFPERVLKDAPQTAFAAVRVERGLATGLQSKIAKRFPNVSAIDMTQTMAALGKLMRKLSSVVRFFAAFSFIAGLLVVLSSMLATRSARIAQAVYYKILGARGSFVLRVFAYESIFEGTAGALLAAAVSQAGSWALAVKVLDIPYKPFPGASLALCAAALLLVVLAGAAASIPVLKKKPAEFLREQADE